MNISEAIEYFAGELPPGATMAEHPEGGFWVDQRCRNGGMGGPMSTWPRERAAEIGWFDWSAMSRISRRAYAESQCIARVRAVWGADRVWVMWEERTVAIDIMTTRMDLLHEGVPHDSLLEAALSSVMAASSPEGETD